MNKTKRFIAVFLLLVSVFTLCSCAGVRKSRERAVLPTLSASTKEICLVERDNLSNEEYTMISTLQGIVAKDQAKIYIKDSENLIYLKSNTAYADAEVKEFEDVWELIEYFKPSLCDNGCVIFDDGSNPTVNMAASVAGVERWLAVPHSLRTRAEQAGLSVKLDLSVKKNGKYEITQRAIFEQYKDKFNRNIVVHQSPELVTLRDFATAVGAFCFYTDENIRSDVRFRDKVFSWANENAPVLGWSADELKYVKQASENGLYIIPSDHCTNLSFLSGWKIDGELRQKAKMQPIKADKTKHYIAFIMSDGDNVQWYETSFPYNGHFKDRTQTESAYKLTWTAPPLLQYFAPSAMDVIYNMASENDAFICGVSGMGYINPTEYPKDKLEAFVADSINAAKRADLSVFATLDNTTSVKKLKKAMEIYAAHDEIKGGFMQVGHKYEELGGEIIKCGSKPFISAGKSFWYTSDTPDEKATKEYIEQFASEINALPADINSKDGYTYINVHPWSTTIADLDYLVSLLDEDVEIVFAEELLALVAENVKG